MWATRGVTMTDIALRTVPEETSSLLLVEMNHRWCNGLQAIGASLRLCRRQELSADSMRRRLAAIDGQLAAQASLHRRLSAPPPPGVSLSAHCLAICLDVAASFGRANVAPQVDICQAPLSDEQALKLGLMVAELMTNAVKHGGK